MMPPSPPLLTLITVNYQNAAGLERTLRSVDRQTCQDFEHLVIDGGSRDGSVAVLQGCAKPYRHWLSEPDGGIYPAMNKGLARARGRYVQFLNSGDLLSGDEVVARMYAALEETRYPPILYGNMRKVLPGGGVRVCGRLQDLGLRTFYHGTLNHSPAYIRRSLFEKYGPYDPTLKIVSDWKWYLQAIVLGGEEAVYAPIDVSLFEGGGISETQPELHAKERRQVLEALLPAGILRDYDRFGFAMDQFCRLQQHPWAYRLVWLLERCLFKCER